MPTEYLTVEDVAEQSGTTAAWVRQLCREGRIEATKMPIPGSNLTRFMISPEVAQEWIANKRPAGFLKGERG